MTLLLFLSLAVAGATTPEPSAVASDVQPAAEQRAPVATATTPTSSLDSIPARDRQICRRQARTGTLSGFERICHTEAEWRAVARGSQQSWQQMQGAFGSTHGREGGSLVCSPNGVGC